MRLQLKNKKIVSLVIISAIILITTLGLAQTTHAIDCKNPDSYYTKSDGSIDPQLFFDVQKECNSQEKDISGWDLITGGINTAVAWVVQLLNIYIFSPLIAWEAMYIPWLMDPQHFQFATSPLVHTGWYMSLQIANMVLVLGLLVLADKIILGLESFGDYKKLLKYVVAAIFINFSLTIAGFIIGASNALTVYFAGLAGTQAEMTNRLMQLTSVYAAMTADTSNVIVGIFLGFIAIIMLVLLALILGAILFALFKRILTLWITLIFMPLAYILGVVDFIKVKGAENAWGRWTGMFMGAITFPPLMAFFLWFTFLVMDRASDLYTAGNYDDQFWLQKLLQAAIFTGILLFGFQTANEASGGAAGAIGGWIDKTAKGWGIDKAAFKTGQRTLKKFGATVGNKIFSSETAKNIARRMETSPILSRIPLLNRIPSSINANQKKSEQILKDEAQKHIDTLKGSLPSDAKEAAKFLVKTVQNKTLPKEVRAAAANLLYSEEKYRKNIHEAFAPGGVINTANLRNFVNEAKNIAKANAVEFKDDEIARIYPTIKTGADFDKLIPDLSSAELASSPIRDDDTIVKSSNKEQIAGVISRLRNRPAELTSYLNKVKTQATLKTKAELRSDKSIQGIIMDNLRSVTNPAALRAATAPLVHINSGIRSMMATLRAGGVPINPIVLQTVIANIKNAGGEIPLDLDDKISKVLTMPTGTIAEIAAQRTEAGKVIPHLRAITKKLMDSKVIESALA